MSRCAGRWLAKSLKSCGNLNHTPQCRSDFRGHICTAPMSAFSDLCAWGVLRGSATELHVELGDTEALAKSLNDICIAWGNSASMHLLPTSMALKGKTFRVNLPLSN